MPPIIFFFNSFSFLYSPRPGTIASNLELIDKKITLKRLEVIQNELFNNQIKMNKNLENKIINVLVENITEETNKYFGRSEHMTPVIFNGNDNDVGKILKIRIKRSNQNTLFGEIIRKSELKVA